VCNVLTESCKESLPMFILLWLFFIFSSAFLHWVICRKCFSASGRVYNLYVIYCTSKMNVSFAKSSSWMVFLVIIKVSKMFWSSLRFTPFLSLCYCLLRCLFVYYIPMIIIVLMLLSLYFAVLVNTMLSKRAKWILVHFYHFVVIYCPFAYV
jgi:hypothetical protein